MPYSISDSVVIRTPRLSFDLYFSGEYTQKIKDDDFIESLYLASPSVVQLLFAAEHKDKDALPSVIIKYILRSCFRCTPFGLFAGLSTIQFGDETNILFNGEKRSSRLDMQTLFMLSEKLSSVFFQAIKYSANNSIYMLRDRLRYIEFTLKNNKRYYGISEVILSKELKGLLNSIDGGMTFTELTKKLVSNGVAKKDATDFINTLILNQLLISELEPGINVNKFISDLTNILQTRLKNDENWKPLFEIINDVHSSIGRLDERIGNSIHDYEKILSLLRRLEIDFEENKVFQVDLIKKTSNNSLDRKIQNKLWDGLEALVRLNQFSENEKLNQFKIRFTERYGNQQIPLLEVLDDEIGIGYDPIEGDVTSLIEHINVVAAPGKKLGEQNEIHHWLHQKVQKALLNDEYTIAIQKEELNNFEPNWNNLPSSFSIFFKVTDFVANKVHIESIGGSSAVSVLGRFAYADPEINKLATDIAIAEQKNNPNVILAEIVHIPENRLGNVVSHPPFYTYEIPYLTKSSLPTENQIPLNDLLVTVEGDSIKILSKKLNKEIIPRLSNAYNFTLSVLPVYQFLCDVLVQNHSMNITFWWGDFLEKSLFVPRVTYRDDIILYAASWNLPKSEWGILLNSNNEELSQRLREFRRKWKLPQYVIISDAGNDLFIDLEHDYTIKILLETVRKKDKIILREFLFDKNTPIKDQDGRLYVHQFVASVIKDEPVFGFGGLKTLPTPKIAECNFIPGSEWIYFKYYGGVKSADVILTTIIKPLGEALVKQKLIDSWFFIRYKDPHPHIRVRFHLTNTKYFNKVIAANKTKVKKSIETGLIWKIQIDTYCREMERYGYDSMGLSEELFYYDSLAVTTFLKKTVSSPDIDELRWLWGLKGINDLLDDFKFSLEDKMQFMYHLRISFSREFKLTKFSRLEIDKKYRKYTNLIKVFLGSSASDYSPLFKIIETRSQKIAPIVNKLLELKMQNKLTVQIKDLVRSYVHMFVNRLIPQTQRLHEMIIYDFMHRYYVSQKVRRKIENHSEK